MLQKNKIEEAKNVDILQYLSRKGFEPVSEKSSSRLAFLSPFRNEKTPSFYIDIKTNTFKDFGVDERGGDIITLAKKFNDGNFTSAILDLLDTTETRGIFQKKEEEKETVKVDKKIVVSEVKPLYSYSLIRYVESRCISKKLAEKHLCEVVYYNGSHRKFFSLGFQNDSGGFELRNRIKEKEIKLCSSKDISTIMGENENAINVFEGFFSFLSALQYYNQITPKYTCIVLNSLSLLSRAKPIMEQVERINLFLDNDEAGRKATKKILATYSKAKDFSMIYEKYKDFNELLINR